MAFSRTFWLGMELARGYQLNKIYGNVKGKDPFTCLSAIKWPSNTALLRKEYLEKHFHEVVPLLTSILNQVFGISYSPVIAEYDDCARLADSLVMLQPHPLEISGWPIRTDINRELVNRQVERFLAFHEQSHNTLPGVVEYLIPYLVFSLNLSLERQQNILNVTHDDYLALVYYLLGNTNSYPLPYEALILQPNRDQFIVTRVRKNQKHLLGTIDRNSLDKWNRSDYPISLPVEDVVTISDPIDPIPNGEGSPWLVLIVLLSLGFMFMWFLHKRR